MIGLGVPPHNLPPHQSSQSGSIITQGTSAIFSTLIAGHKGPPGNTPGQHPDPKHIGHRDKQPKDRQPPNFTPPKKPPKKPDNR